MKLRDIMNYFQLILSNKKKKEENKSRNIKNL